MPRTDYEFRTLSGIEGELVRPTPNNDVYAGLFMPVEGVFATNRLDLILHSSQPFPYTATLLAGQSANGWGYLDRDLGKHMPAIPVYREHSDVKVDVPMKAIETSRDTGDILTEAGDLYRRIMAVPRHLLPEDLAADEAGISETRLKKIREKLTSRRQSPQEYLFTTNEKGQPRSPSIRYADLFELIAYRWQEGPNREGAGGVHLPPTYGPRPSQLAVISTVTIEFVNPLVEQAA